MTEKNLEQESLAGQTQKLKTDWITKHSSIEYASNISKTITLKEMQKDIFLFCAQKIREIEKKAFDNWSKEMPQAEKEMYWQALTSDIVIADKNKRRDELEQVRVETAKEIFERLEDNVLFLDTSKTLTFQKGNYDEIKAKFLQEKKTE